MGFNLGFKGLNQYPGFLVVDLWTMVTRQ